MIKYALLGLLREQCDYGYSLRRRFEERVGALWNLNTGQVYQTLRTLEKAGLVRQMSVESESVPSQDSARPRRVFELTARGGHVLERWLRRLPTRTRLGRDETLLRLLMLQPERHYQALEHMQKLTHLYKQQMRLFLAHKRRLPAQGDGWLLVREIAIESALLHTEAQLRWLEYTQRRLSEGRDNGNGG